MSFPHTLHSMSPASSVDFVEGDLLALASHMQRCARSRGFMPGLQTAFQTGRAMAAGRLVTVACIGLGVAFAVLVLA